MNEAPRETHDLPPRQVDQELALRDRQLAAFHQISDAIQADESGPQVFNTIAREVAGLAGFPIGTIELCDFDRATVIVQGTHGLDLQGLPTPFEIPMDVALCGHVAQTGEPLLETDMASRRENATPFLKQLGVRTVLCVPIKNQGRVVGTVTLAHREQFQVEPHVITQVESLANFVGALFGRREAREALRRGEAELAAVYDSAPSVMCLVDDQLHVVRANRAALEFAHRAVSEIAGLPIGDFFRCPCARQTARRGFTPNTCTECELCRAVAETFRTDRTWQRVRVNKMLLHHDHLEERVILLSTERIRVDGVTRVLLCLEDVTLNEQADEKIRSQAELLEITRDAILLRDFSDHILYWNAGAERLYGWTAAEVAGKTMSGLLLGKDTRTAIEALRAVRDKEDWTGEMKHLTRDGKELTVQSRWTLVRDSHGGPKGILVVSTDITDKKRMESQLLRSQRLESIGTLASGLAHDLNNVLAPIMMAVQCLKEEAVGESVRTWLQTLETCSQRGADIVRQVLTFARGVEGSRVPLNPKHLVLEMQRIARETFPRSINVTAQICKEPRLIEADATQIQQVLMNLCVNARDAMPDGGTLTLNVENAEMDEAAARLHPKARPGSHVVLSVSDTGTGIAPEVMDKMFDPFFTTKPLGHGTGLGLPTVLGIAQSHHGFIIVDSALGKGTTFRVYLPATGAKLEKPEGDTKSIRMAQGKGELIMIVDDEPAVREITDLILSRNGYRTVLAQDGREAVALFAERPDEVKLVVTDLMMPKLDGAATIRALREIRPNLKTVTITGVGEEHRRADARTAGTSAILSKPFTAEQLLAEVKTYLA